MQDKNLCVYYQAVVKREECWKLTATLRSFEHLCFDRTYDKSRSVFEFFVPAELEQFFIQIMAHFEEIGLISELQKMPNRLLDPGSKL
jgi:hypothetical protein